MSTSSNSSKFEVATKQFSIQVQKVVHLLPSTFQHFKVQSIINNIHHAYPVGIYDPSPKVVKNELFPNQHAKSIASQHIFPREQHFYGSFKQCAVITYKYKCKKFHPTHAPKVILKAKLQILAYMDSCRGIKEQD